MINPRFALISLSTLAFLLSTPFAHAQDASPSDDRPKVGLVLAGGAAYGFVHLGVLKWMEQHRVPVDYIAGTSMGSLLGGFYASGMSVPEMERQLTAIDWDDLFRGATPHRLRTFRRKEDTRDLQNNFEFGRGFTTQTGLDAIHPVGLLLSRINFPYPDDIKFDDLPIPFRCTAVELNSAKVTRFSEGSLWLAMRASMSIPLAFTTVEENGRSFVDGGVFDNLPIDTMIGPNRPDGWKPSAVVSVRMVEDAEKPNGNAETKPTSNTESGSTGKSTPSNILDVVARLIVAITSENTDRSLALADKTPGIVSVPILAKIHGFSTEDFTAWRAIEAVGFAEAEKSKDILLKYQLSEADWKTYLARKAARRHRTVKPVRVVIAPQDLSRKLDPRLQTFLRTRLNKYANRTFNIEPDVRRDPNSDALARDLNDLTGSGIFESISYNQMTLGGKPALAIRPKEKPYGPPFFLTSLLVDSGDTDNVQTTLHLRTNFLGRGIDATDEVRLDFFVGSQRELRAEWYRPTTIKPVFLLPYAYTRKEQRSLYAGGATGANFSVNEAAVGIDAGLDLGRFSQFRMGQLIGKRDYSSYGASTLPNDRGTVNATTFRFVYDGQDDAIIPHAGLYSIVRGSFYHKAPSAPDGYGQVYAQAWQAFPLSRRDILHVAVTGGKQTNGVAPIGEQFTLGGPFRLTAYFNGELRGQNQAFGTIGYMRQMTPRFSLIGGAFYLGAWYEEGIVQTTGIGQTRRRDVHVGGFAPTHLGPLALGRKPR